MRKEATLPVSNIRRARVMRLLRRGLILQTEAAAMLGVSRQLVHQWVQAGRVPRTARERYLRRLMHDH